MNSYSSTYATSIILILCFEVETIFDSLFKQNSYVMYIFDVLKCSSKMLTFLVQSLHSKLNNRQQHKTGSDELFVDLITTGIKIQLDFFYLLLVLSLKEIVTEDATHDDYLFDDPIHQWNNQKLNTSVTFRYHSLTYTLSIKQQLYKMFVIFKQLRSCQKSSLAAVCGRLVSLLQREINPDKLTG